MFSNEIRARVYDGHLRQSQYLSNRHYHRKYPLVMTSCCMIKRKRFLFGNTVKKRVSVLDIYFKILL